MTTDAFHFMRIDSAAIAIVEISYAPLAIWEINLWFDYDLCDQVAISLRSERITTDLCARESTDGDLGDNGDQLETN